MTRRSQKRWTRIVLAACFVGAAPVLTAACGHSSPTRFFTLDAIEPSGPRVNYRGPPIRVRGVHIPPALDRVEIVEEDAPDQIKVRDLEHWAAPLGLTARQAIMQDLVARLPSGAVVASDGPLPQGAVDLQIDILSYNLTGGSAVMQVEWRIVGAAALKPDGVVVETLQSSLPRTGGAESLKGSLNCSVNSPIKLPRSSRLKLRAANVPAAGKVSTRATATLYGDRRKFCNV